MLDRDAILEALGDTAINEEKVAKLLGNLSEEEQTWAMQMLREHMEKGASDTLAKMYSIDFVRQPVSLEQFINDPFYLGNSCEGVYDVWRKELNYVFRPGSEVFEWIFTGAIRGGKTFTASVAMTYKLYILSCTKNPQTYLGLGDPNTAIYFGIFSVRLSEAEETSFDYIKQFVDNSPYFRKYFPRNKKVNYRLDFPHRIRVNFGSKELHALGRAMICVIIDEANFMKGGAIGDAYKLYYQVRARITGQYGYRGNNPGMLFVISSRNTESDFLEKHIERFMGEKGVHLSDYALWETKPSSSYCGDNFRVAVGNKYKSSRILDEDEDNPIDQNVIDVPVEHRTMFVNNISQAIRDLAGVPVYAVSNYLQDRTKMLKCSNATWKHPFTKETVELDYRTLPKISDWFKIRDVCKVVGSKYVPRLNPEVMRFAHVDLALSGDACGIAVCHSAGMKKQIHTIQDEFKYSVSTMEINVDFMLRIVGAPGSQIDISAIREFFIYLRRNGFMFNKITYDGYQSASSIQDLVKVGFNSERLSVDIRTDPYDFLRDVLMEERLHMYQYDPVISEIGQLQRIVKGRRAKIDHPADGSKDVADALAGAVFLCSKDNATYPFHRDRPQFKNSNEKLVQKAFNLKKKTGDGFITGIQGQGNIEWDY